ncbi:MAG: phenylalanine--tRNA ligase subunit alpha [Planctomycetes bacterium]|nr:phenylalanine--tRNA ligase subunit alpha [Planctomycetota bacterium]MBM4058705.1 phenylalanine--tRNA ligase subunit alpha [Planctomycetota bacterium]
MAGTPLDTFRAELERLRHDAAEALAAATNAAAVEAARVEFAGARSGRLKAAQKLLGAVPAADKPAAGRDFNDTKASVAALLETAQERFARVEDQADDAIDVTLPGEAVTLGRFHPITQTIRQIQEIMGQLGFECVDGPEVEDQWHNFEALAISPEHPARDPLDNFYLAVARGADPLLLRSQTSTVQIRVMESRDPPLRIVSLGRVYRPDTADATHYPMFHQVEGLFVEPGTNMAHLKSVLRLFASRFLGGDVHVRFRPSFFPFTEPSVEVDMEWGGRWVEMGGAGMVDPAVLAAVGYDQDAVTGFAFGLGVERIAARRYGVEDIRDFYRNDVRFLRQF